MTQQRTVHDDLEKVQELLDKGVDPQTKCTFYSLYKGQWQYTFELDGVKHFLWGGAATEHAAYRL